jgi:hypothetical protein
VIGFAVLLVNDSLIVALDAELVGGVISITAFLTHEYEAPFVAELAVYETKPEQLDEVVLGA